MNKMITICTATYNRGYKISELYESLLQQSNKNFEWIVIDDESSDNTKELIHKWEKNNNGFLIKYVEQQHGGKHRAINRAVELASGEFIFIVDSDDRILPEAVELIHKWIDTCENNLNIAAVAGLKVSSEGEVWGGITKIDKKYIDASNFERGKYHLNGDKAEVYRKSLLKKYKFPEFENEFFVTEDICWMNIAAAGYKIRWFNEPIYIAEYLEDGLSKRGANDIEGHRNNFKGYCFYISECIKKKPFTDKLVHIREYDKTCKYLGIKIKDRANNVNISLTLYIFMCKICVPIGWLIRKIRKY